LLKRFFKLGDGISAHQPALQFQDAYRTRFFDIEVHDTLSFKRDFALHEELRLVNLQASTT